MQVPLLRHAACCHGAAILDKQRQEQSALRQLWQEPWN
jgi:hypothetical protein